MSNIFAKLLEEGNKQQAQLRQQTPPTPSQIPTEVYSKPVQSDSTTARQQAVKVAVQHDSKPSRQHDSMGDYLAIFLESKASNKTTLRYPPSLMAEIDEVIYQIKKTHHTTLSKNEIFVFALAYLLYDFKQNASHSLLFKTLIQPKQAQ